MPDRSVSLFTPEAREELTDQLIASLRREAGVEDVVRLGSIADGTTDRHSDVDLAVVVTPGSDVAPIAAKCTETVRTALPVFHHFSQSLGEMEFRGFLLESFLEIDLGFARPGQLEAATAVPTFDAAAKLDFVWHDVIHAAVALKDADDLPPETLAAASAAIAAGHSEAQIWRALRAAASALFAEGRHTHPEISDKLEPKLIGFLDLIEHNRSPLTD